MRRYNIIYYFLFIALVLGAFAAMAQYEYGNKLMGGACFGFFLMFVHELVFSISSYEQLSARSRTWLAIEITALAVLALCFFLNTLLIEIPFGLWILSIAIVVLILVTVRNAIRWIQNTERRETIDVWTVSFYYAAIFFLATAFLMGIWAPAASEYLAWLGLLLGLVLVAMLALLIKPKTENEGTAVSRQRNKSGLLLIGFALIFLYSVLHAADALPDLYPGDVPPGYLKLLRDQKVATAPSGKNEARIYMEEYNKFLKRHRN